MESDPAGLFARFGQQESGQQVPGPENSIEIVRWSFGDKPPIWGSEKTGSTWVESWLKRGNQERLIFMVRFKRSERMRDGFGKVEMQRFLYQR